MDHAEAAERLADLATEPLRLTAFESDPSPDTRELRAHVAACPTCAADLAAWRRSWAVLALGTGEDDDGTGLTAPGSLRAAVLAAVAAEPRVAGRSSVAPGAARPIAPSSARRPARLAPWLAVAAALVLAVSGIGVAWDRAGRLDRAQAEASGLAATTAAIGRVLADPVHGVASLRSADGTGAGTVAWTGGEIVVVAADLPALPAGSAYRCWVERSGVRTPVGPMFMSGSTGYWAGPMGGWADLMSSGATFGVSVVAPDGSSSVVLVGTI